MTGNAKRGVLGGIEPDPEAGKPYRHTRQKARLMLADLNEEQVRQALILLLDKRPEDVLDALIKASGET